MILSKEGFIQNYVLNRARGISNTIGLSSSNLLVEEAVEAWNKIREIIDAPQVEQPNIVSLPFKSKLT